jgi:hypothetical protein
MTTRQAKGKSSKFKFASLARLLPPEVAAFVRGEEIDLTGVSLFFRRQAECAALFGSCIVQIKPCIFILKSPFKENFIASLHAYHNVNMSPAENVAYSLVRHATWYLKIHDVDALRARGTSQIKPRALCCGNVTWQEGIITTTGQFSHNPEAEGKPAILVWQDNTSTDPPSFAIEICGPGVAPSEPSFRRALLQSMIDSVSVQLGLKHRVAGRPHHTKEAESVAYLRDHQLAGRWKIAKSLCSCGRSKHTQECCDKLNKLAHSFYRTQRSQFEKLVREHARKNPKIKQENI